MNAQDTQHGGFAHDHFPAVQQKGQQVGTDAWQYFPGIAVESGWGIGSQVQAFTEAPGQVRHDGAGMQCQRKDARQHGWTEQNQEKEGEKELRGGAQHH